MAANETREPTLAEIMKEIRDSKDETIKNIESLRRSMLPTHVAVGIAITFFGLSYFLPRLETITLGTSDLWDILGILISAIPMAVGVIVMILGGRSYVKKGKTTA
ncbi:MAG: hypothetical protein ACOC7P_02310 [Chloroflexota bacterium]